MNKTANYVVFAAIVIATFLTVINSNMVRLASPHLQAELNVSYSNLSWVFNSHQIAYAILLPVFGLIGDKFGRKYLVAGVAIFGLGLFWPDLPGISLLWSYSGPSRQSALPQFILTHWLPEQACFPLNTAVK